MFIDRQYIKIDELKNTLKAKIAPNSESLVIINADEKVEHEIVVKVVERLRQVPRATMAIAATRE